VFRFPELTGSLSAGATDITVIDPVHQWTVEPNRFASKGRNSPLRGVQLTGSVRAVILTGALAFEMEAAGV
jgi:dihydroorotase